MLCFPGGALCAIDYGVPCNSEEPCREGRPAPFKSRNVCECLMEYFGGQVLGFGPVAHPPGDECIHALEVILIKFGEPARVLLRRLYEKPLRQIYSWHRQRAFSCIHPSVCRNRRDAERLRSRATLFQRSLLSSDRSCSDS